MYIYIYIYIQSTPYKWDSKRTRKMVRLSDMSDLSNPTYPINLTWI